MNYTRSIVSYLDILGFRELIEKRTAGEVSRILRILAESIAPHPTDEPVKIEFTKFSDTVIRSTPEPSPAYFIYELKTILRAQVALIPEGVPIRGAVTIGEITQSWDVVYGPAVVRAYELDSGPPRIVIDDKALSLLRPPVDANFLVELGLTRLEGTTVYLDYLKACEVELRVEDEEYLQFLEIHRDFIRRCLGKYAEKRGVLEKYEWLRTYHERILQERFGSEIPPHLNV
ncbi:MAG TPA: hypothetical protein VKH63_21325 [Candidatus Acidoferrum sp.]|nr:hypothetical protein [Candidatus Acidoferrum sp.]